MEKNQEFVYTYEGHGLEGNDKKKAKKRFKEYRTHYDIENLSDLTLLEGLVFREILQSKILEKIAELQNAGDKSNVVPGHLLDDLDNNQEQILKLKDKLGLFQEKEISDAFRFLQLLFKKFATWLGKNKDSRKITCPFCSKLFFLKLRTTNYDAHISPFFENKIIGNKPLFDAYKKGKPLTKDDVANILGVSKDYFIKLDEMYK